MQIASTLNIPSSLSTDSVASVNAHGVGSANAPEVVLSPQAQMLSKFPEKSTPNATDLSGVTEAAAEPRNESIQVSSSIGKSARSANLSSEQAMKIYRSIENLL